MRLNAHRLFFVWLFGTAKGNQGLNEKETQMLPVAQPGIMTIAPYQGGSSKLAGIAQPIKLSSNENPLGPSEVAIEAFKRSAYEMHRYPSTDHAELREAIGQVHGLPVDQLICGVGSDEILSWLCSAYAGVGDEVIHTEHGFAMYRISTLAAGATPVSVPETDRTVDVQAILNAVTERTKIVFIANPANPTGTFLPNDTLRELADGLPPHVLLVLDGAYAEYVDGYDGGAQLVRQYENVVMTRTFSKIYGLGAIRVGWAYAPAHIIDVLGRIRGPFNLSSVALGVATAAVKDQAYVAHCRTNNARGRDMLTEGLREFGLQVDTSFANFLLVRFASPEAAQTCNEELQAAGLIVRSVAGYGLPEALRITVGDESACRQVLHAIGQARQSAA